MRSLFLAPRSGQALIMAAFMLAVFFAMLGLVVDIGLLMVHRRQQQNAADSAAFGVAWKLAGSVGVTASGTIVFIDQTDATVMSRAQTLASGNWFGTVASQTIGMEYVDCSGQCDSCRGGGCHHARARQPPARCARRALRT